MNHKIANISLLGAVLVISIHCGFAECEGGVGWLLERFVSGGYARIAVPFFFVFSGYFLAKHVDEQGWWKRESIKRFNSLVVPFVLWALLYQILLAPLVLLADFQAGRPIGANFALFNGEIMRVLGLLLDEKPYTYHLWYLRALFAYAIISPIVVTALRRFPKIWLSGLFLGTIALYFTPPTELRCLKESITLCGLFYFSLGIYLRMNPIRRTSRLLGLLAIAIGLIFLVIQAMGVFHLPRLFLTELAIPFMMYATWVYMSSSSLPNILQGLSFPIYLSHCIFIAYWAGIARRVGLSVNVSSCLAWPLGLAGALLFTFLLRTYLPKLFRTLTGGRA